MTLFRSIGALFGLCALMALFIFVPAGSIDYWEAWVYLALFAALSAYATIDLARRDPALLARRMKGGPLAEKHPAQRIIMSLATVGYIALLLVPALDFRYDWSDPPDALIFAGDALVILGFLAIIRVYRENTFAAATVQVIEGQRVIDTGPYAIVRHPMYAGGLLFLAGTPLALASYWGLLVIPVIVPFLIWRLIDEERLLERDLPGYVEYVRRVRRRLVPFIW